MKWILIYVLYSHTPEGISGRAASVSTESGHIVFDDQRACYSVRDGIRSGAFNKGFEDNTVTADAACVPQSSTDQLGPLK